MEQHDGDSFRLYVEARWESLLRLANLLCGGDRHEAEDLVQTALMKALGHWRRIDDPEAYVRTVMYRHQAGRWRLRRPPREPTFAAPPDTTPVPDETSAADLRLAVRQALTRLTARQRTVLVLRYFEDKTETEVAAVLGCSVGTVRSTTYRALARLRILAPDLREPRSTPSTVPHTGTPKGVRT